MTDESYSIQDPPTPPAKPAPATSTTPVPADPAPRVSLAIPVYNEREILPQLLLRVRGVLDKLPGGPHEVVLVDDGSRDGTREMLVAAAAEDPRIVAVLLSRNFGHQVAITAAMDNVSGDVIVCMDGDLQDPPEAVPKLLAKYAEGFDVVYVQRGKRQEGWLLKFCYKAYYRLLSSMSEVGLPLDAGDFALLSRRVVDSMRAAPERHRYLRGLRAWVGFKQTGLLLDRAARAGGKSKYTPIKLFRLAANGIFAFSIVPLRAAVVLGAMAICASMLYLVYALITRFIYPVSTPPGFTTLIIAIVFLAGVQMLLLGVVGEYVGRIYEEVKGRPHYIIEKVVRAKEAKD
ncbi:MAG TPA: glycosyltransferase family 2 protein [Pirellulales bacterium]|jgi:dolichol-phosphate mannosyltransferase